MESLAVRLYRKIRKQNVKFGPHHTVTTSYLVISGTWKNNQELKDYVDKHYPGWIIDQVAPVGQE